MLVGTCVGVITGFIIAVVYGVRLGVGAKPTNGLQKINE